MILRSNVLYLNGKNPRLHQHFKTSFKTKAKLLNIPNMMSLHKFLELKNKAKLIRNSPMPSCPETLTVRNLNKDESFYYEDITFLLPDHIPIPNFSVQ